LWDFGLGFPYSEEVIRESFLFNTGRGASSDERFHGFNSRMGKKLRTTKLSDVAAMAAGGGGPLTAGAPPPVGRLYVFALL
jgi:hypothetical protein